MDHRRRIVLTLSPEFSARLEARAAEGQLGAHEWALRVLRVAVARPESKAARARRCRKAGFALLGLLAGRPAETACAQDAAPDRRVT